MLPIVTDHLFAHLAGQRVPADSPVLAGLRSALGLLPQGGIAPVTGYFASVNVDTATPSVLVYAVCGSRLVRYEWLGGQTLTVTMPLSRVSCLSERTAGTELVVSIEMDAQPSATVGEFQLRTSPDADSADDDTLSFGRMVLRGERATYTLQAGDGAQVAMLTQFSTALRLSLHS